MSYDLYFEDAHGTVVLDEPHHLRGGTYALGGERRAYLNVTYNYYPHFRDALGVDGIRSLDGKTGREVAALLPPAIEKLGTKRDHDYWSATPGNAGAALRDLLTLAEACPDAVLRVSG